MGVTTKSGMPDPFKHVPGQLQQIAREFFGRQLEELGLTARQIERMTRGELEASLVTVQDAIDRVESFGVLRLKVSADAGVIIARANNEAHFECTMLPVLLEAKKHVLLRLDQLRSKEEIESLAQLVDGISDEETRRRLNAELRGLQDQVASSRQRLDELQADQVEAIARTQASSAETIATLTKELEQIREQATQYRLLFASSFAIVGLVTVLLLPTLASWSWLLHHDRRFGLQASAAVLILGMAWCLADAERHRRWFALGSVVLAALIAILQLA